MGFFFYLYITLLLYVLVVFFLFIPHNCSIFIFMQIVTENKNIAISSFEFEETDIKDI